MPIFEKNDQSVYFAHAPKTAGSAIYILFLRNGWSISNVQTSTKNKGRIGYKILKEFGIEHIPTVGARFGYKWALQHAPSSVWSRWGAFDSSFSIVRDPRTRFISCVTYHALAHGLGRPSNSLIDECIDGLMDHRDNDPDQSPPLFRRQVDFIKPDTTLLKFESNWMQALASLYGFAIAEVEYVNKKRGADLSLNETQTEFIDDYYKADFDLWRRV